MTRAAASCRIRGGCPALDLAVGRRGTPTSVAPRRRIVLGTARQDRAPLAVPHHPRASVRTAHARRILRGMNAQGVDLDNFEVRRVYLEQGGNPAAAGRLLDCSRQTVGYHVARANQRRPIEFDGLRLLAEDPEDKAAVRAYLLKVIERAGMIVREPSDG